MKIIKYISLVFLFFAFSGSGFSNNGTLRFHKLNTVDGLNSNVVYALFQDSHGFIWMGTKEGINRYDGYSIRSFSLPFESYKNIAHQRINSICEDQLGYIWLGTPNGIIQMDAFSGKMIHYSLPYETKASQSQYVNSIVISNQNEIWVGTRNGLYLFNQENKEFNQYEHFPFSSKSINYSKGERVINDLCFDSQQNLWIATAGNGLTVLDISLKKKRVFKRLKGQNISSISSNYIESIYKDSRGTMWLATSNGLGYYNPEEESFSTYCHSDKISYSILDNSVTTIAEDLDGQLWIGSKKGLDRFDRISGEFYHYQNHPLRPESISSNTILSLLADRSGNFWVGSMQGINYFYTKNLLFDLYQNIPDNKNSLVDNTLRTLVAHPSGKIWIGSLKDGINSFDPKTQNFLSYRMEYGTERWKRHNAIRTAYVDRENKLFFGTDGGVLLYNRVKNCFENFDAQGKIIFKKGVFEIMQDSHGYYWFAEIDKGLWRWHPSKGETQLYKKDSVSGLISTNLKVMHQTSDGDIWVGTHMKGLCKLPYGQTKFISYKHSEKSRSLSNNSVYAIFEDSKKNLWIGTGSGLNKYNKLNESFDIIGVKEGLAGKVVLSIQEDSLGRLWLGTNKGLSCFDVEKQQVANFYQEDGLQGNIFEYKVACKHFGGQLYFGGNNGLNAFNPMDFKMNTYLPNLQFIQVSSSRGIVNISRDLSVYDNDIEKIRIDDSERNVSVELTSDSYVEAYKNTYVYRILPQDSTWKPLDLSKHKIELPALEVGDHSLAVKVSNNHMKWSPKVKVLQIEVSRDWSKNSGLLYGLLISSVLILIVWLRKSRFRMIQTKKYNTQQQDKKTIKNISRVKVSAKDVSEWAESTKQLMDFMRETLLYRDKRLTKGQLAVQIGWTEVYLSSTLREGLESNFNDFINSFRVEDVKERLKDPRSRDFTLIAIAEECGFNSKTSFYRTFKKFTDLTPSEYLEQIDPEA
ncbi:AraC family transcriptional regulator [Ancylomarina euxinus]|uniref:AraC family transcriptional regulator n=1 Tax=Ancylomarina euxinus TaxID=2283627 RepID=A0A425XZ71_9BACT|nr:AraC family transcriptional regulator [Ancylomarina euxinus]MCZ4694777.1 helix-turn-helix domain-containing protein [Ancylomarina euxinus]MUP15851.1 helix-turn-helix domain-containing protein [Ancylomarina euxinus]RRG20491.1 AraC family transcriptional regulator [Ancylomarina euxinus]